MAASGGWMLAVLLTFGIELEAFSGRDEFSEELLIKPLHSGHIYSHFQFTTTWEVDFDNPKAFAHYRLFPKPLGEILAKYRVQELHLTQTQGLWRHRHWGYPVIDAPTGAQLWVWFQQDTNNIDRMWSGLTNTLSGLFCSTINFMDSSTALGSPAVSPHLAFRPLGAANERHAKNSSYLRHAAMSGENVCTENLTPWKKLLPCDSKAGLSMLFSAQKLYDASYHSLGLHYRPVCQDEACEKTAVELSQTLAVVSEPSVSITRGRQDWSFKKMFGHSVKTACPVASRSEIYVDLSTNKSSVYSFVLKPRPPEVKVVQRGGNRAKYAVYDVKKRTKGLNLMATYSAPILHKDNVLPPLYVHRFITGYGQEKGGVTCQLHNTHATDNLTITYLEVVPWLVKMYYHSLAIQTNGQPLKTIHQSYTAARERERPHLVEIVLILPPNSTTSVSYQFDTTFLKWTEYPPDANHGFYINSAVIGARMADHSHVTMTSHPKGSSRLADRLFDDEGTYFLRIYSEAVLVNVPTPDFSMPYNVICLACTVVAIGFGSVHNLTTKTFRAVDPDSEKGFIGKVKDKVLGLFRRQKTTPSSDDDEAKKDR